MSGVVATLHRDGRPASGAALWDMLAAAPYRGPDGSAVGLFGVAGLGHAKMAVTAEEERERQPLVSPRTGCAIVADARLDNRGELLGRLPDRVPADASDAELILRSYEGWGTGAPERLLGDFAFVVWDPRERRLVCARDTGGQRALFYRDDARSFAAASEIQQLLRDPSVPVAPDEGRVRDFLVPSNVFASEKQQAATFYAGVRSVEAGHVLVADDGGVRTRRYWDMGSVREVRYRREGEYAERYLELFTEAVRCRLRSSRPVGAMLSGGLDSTSIVGVAQGLYRSGRAADRGFASFSFVFDGLECDERALIEDVRGMYGFDAQYISAGSYAGRLQLHPLGFQESPNVGVREASDALYARASNAGVRVMLSGEIADSIVYGSHLVFDSLFRKYQFAEFGRRLKAYRRVSDDSMRTIIGLYCLAPLLPLRLQKFVLSEYLTRTIKRSRRRLLPPWLTEHLREDLIERQLSMSTSTQRQRRFSSPARQQEYSLVYPPEVARYPAPWSMERRRPFADRRLHEYLLAIPPEQKFKPHPETDEFYAGSKRLVREAMRGILPESVRDRRSKTIFSGVIDNEIERNWPAYEQAFGPHGKSEVVARGYVDKDRFWSRLQALRDGKQGGDVIYAMQVVGLETWLRSFHLPREQLITIAPPWVEQSTLMGISA